MALTMRHWALMLIFTVLRFSTNVIVQMSMKLGQLAPIAGQSRASV